MKKRRMFNSVSKVTRSEEIWQKQTDRIVGKHNGGEDLANDEEQEKKRY